jgi:single-strand DNA-binding protein
MINSVTLVGRVCNDIEVRFTSSGVAVTNLTVACVRKYNKEETDFIKVVVWRDQAENCHKYIGKGSLIAIEGRLQVSSYENQDGNKVWKTEVVADDVRFLDFRSKDQHQDNGNDPLAAAGKPIDLDDLDLPFDI